MSACPVDVHLADMPGNGTGYAGIFLLLTIIFVKLTPYVERVQHNCTTIACVTSIKCTLFPLLYKHYYGTQTHEYIALKQSLKNIILWHKPMK